MINNSVAECSISSFRSNFVQSMSTWHSIYNKCSRSRDQRSRSERDVTGAKCC